MAKAKEKVIEKMANSQKIAHVEKKDMKKEMPKKDMKKKK